MVDLCVEIEQSAVNIPSGAYGHESTNSRFLLRLKTTDSMRRVIIQNTSKLTIRNNITCNNTHWLIQGY